MGESFNFRNPAKGEVAEMYAAAKKKREQVIKHQMLSKLLNGETIDLRNSSALFEAINRERMEFEEILKLHPDQVKDCIDAVKEDRQGIDENVYWNRESPAKWAKLGHIPPCIYHSRTAEYWNDKKILKNFFNMFTKFRVSTSRL